MGGHDAELILIAGVLLAAGIAGALLADRVRIPGLLLFLGLGMLAGSEGIGGIDFNNAELARTLGTIALVLILFEGGLTSGWSEIRPVLGTAASLATVGTLLTARDRGLRGEADLRPQHPGRDDRRRRRSPPPTRPRSSPCCAARPCEKRLARSLEGESGMNDPVALLLVIGFIEWIQEPGYGLADMAGLLAVKLALGIAIGLAVGLARGCGARRCGCPPTASTRWRRWRSPASPTASPRSPTGPACSPSTWPRWRWARRRSRRGARSSPSTRGSAGSRRSRLFILLGLLIFPSNLDDVALEGLALSAVLIFVARPLGDLRRDRASRRSTGASG